MLHGFDELARFRFLEDGELAAGQRDAQAPGAEGTDEDHLLGVLADVNEAAGAGKLRAEFAIVEIAGPAGLRQAEKRRVETTAVIKIELVRLVDHLCLS